MVKVYMETSGYAELVAIFDDEETSGVCSDAIEKLSEKHNFEYVTESVDESSDIGNLVYGDVAKEIALVSNIIQHEQLLRGTIFNTFDTAYEIAEAFVQKHGVHQNWGTEGHPEFDEEITKFTNRYKAIKGLPL